MIALSLSPVLKLNIVEAVHARTVAKTETTTEDSSPGADLYSTAFSLPALAFDHTRSLSFGA